MTSILLKGRNLDICRNNRDPNTEKDQVRIQGEGIYKPKRDASEATTL
jgi:hypothetical protein